MTISIFGTTAAGQTVQRITLENEYLTVALLTLGVIVQSVVLRGVAHDLTVGSDRLTDYEGAMQYYGALVAPVVNRLNNATAPIDGTPHHFPRNQDNRHTLHSGDAGTYSQIWTITDATDTRATLAATLPDGAGGFPGTRHVTATFSLHGPAVRLEIAATTDKPTLFNAANHSYWNLDGTADWDGHTLQIHAGHYLPTTDDLIPTGEVSATQGTEYDFAVPRPLIHNAPRLDTCFCLADGQRALTHVLTLTGKTGVSLQIATTEPGIQIFDNYPVFHGIAIEPQGWPDAPNHANFPSIALHPGEVYAQTTEWRFAAGGGVSPV